MEEVDTKVAKSEVSEGDFTSCRRCNELEERSKKAQGRIVELESEIEKMKSDYQVLEVKVKELEEAQKALAEHGELTGFRTRNIPVIKQSQLGENQIISIGEKGKEEDEDIVVDLTQDGDDEEDIVRQLMLENCALECEKRKAETEVQVWKQTFKELEGAVMNGGKLLLDEAIKGEIRPDITVGLEQLQINKKLACSLPGTPYKDSPCGRTPFTGKKGACLKPEGECHRVVRKHLSFEEERSPKKKMAPSTPGSCKPTRLNVINICDSDDESDIHHKRLSTANDQRSKKVCSLTDFVLPANLDSEQDMISENHFGGPIGSQDYEEDLDDCKDNVPCALTSKRKRYAKIVASDSESDEDDNVPISKLKKVHLQESIPITNCDKNCNSMSASPSVSDDVKCTVTRSRRRLATLRQCEEKVKAERSSPDKTNAFKHGRGISTIDEVEDGESEEFESGSEGESLGGFIVDSSNGSDADKFSSQSDNKSDGDVDLDEILSKLQRSKDHAFKWELEADMLSAFGKSDELCMKAVCALYRQQTSDEQVSKETMYNNNRGFSKFDALRGSDLARFLTDGEPRGDLKKSVQQLQELGSKAVNLCRTLATRYSKQLFEIYKNKEDPLFLPC